MMTYVGKGRGYGDAILFAFGLTFHLSYGPSSQGWSFTIGHRVAWMEVCW